MSQSYDFDITEGVSSAITTAVRGLIKDPPPTFLRYVVLETISDPTLIDKEKIDYWKNVIGVSNIKFAGALSRNSIIAQKVRTGVSDIDPPMFFLPFFPSHLSLPCKPGEFVWTMFEDPTSRIKEMGFWFCKIATPHIADDVNHTHFPLQLDESFTTSIQKQTNNKNDAIYELRNGKVNLLNGIRSVIQGSEFLSLKHSKNVSISFETLVLNSDASKISQYEAVPRFKKRPGDIAIEGSNNTLIVLGTDRQRAISNQTKVPSSIAEPYRTTVAEHPSEDIRGFTGTVDIVAGRGMSQSTGGRPVAYKSLTRKNEFLFETLEKKAPPENEGDPDYIDDRSRILVAQRTKVDQKFQINRYLENVNSIKDSDLDAAIVIKSDKIRLIARSDISLIVTDYTLETKKGERSTYPYKKEKRYNDEDFNNWASITIKRDGNIVFTPGDYGVIKLGGDDASQAILCTSKDASIDDGNVDALPIASTAGGFVGTAFGNVDEDAVNKISKPDLGTFSTKVLIK